MRKIMLGLLIALSAPSAALADMPFSDRFVHDKSGYIVESRKVGASLKVTGRHPETGKTFALKVSRGGQVSGVWDGRQVAFKIGGASQTAELAAAVGAGAK